MSSTPIVSILKIEDLTNEDNSSYKNASSEPEIGSMEDQSEEGDDEEMIDIFRNAPEELPCILKFDDSEEITENNTTAETQASSSLLEPLRDQKYKIRTNPAQFEAMLNFMYVNQPFARGCNKAPDVRTTNINLWNQLTAILNKNGPPTRGRDGWKKVWGDYKNSIKNKVRKNKIYNQQPRGWPKKLYPMSRQEKRVANLLGFTQNESSTEVTSTLPRTLIINKPEMAAPPPSSPKPPLLNKSSNSIKSDETNNSDDPSKARYSPPLSRKYKKLLLQAQIDTQKDFVKDSKKLLTSINENLKGLLDISVKTYELKQSSLELKREKFLFKKRIEEQRQENEIEKLQLQKDILRMKQEIAGFVN